MWWKLYFFFSIFLLLISILSFWGAENQNIWPHIFLIITFCIALIGLYSVAFNKEIFSKHFWQYYFWLYIAIDVIYLVLGFLPSHVLQNISFLLVYSQTSPIDSIINTAFDIPIIYAMYKLWHGEVVKKKKTNKPFKWGMIQTALWGYSSVLTFFLFILAFIPINNSGTNDVKDVASSTSTTILFIPLLFFWIWVIMEYKNYKWNWWRTTLVANALLYSGIIIFGLLFPSSGQGASGIDIIGILQLLILLFSLYVFGRDQFVTSKVKKEDSIQILP